jgi:hypothetical protein
LGFWIYFVIFLFIPIGGWFAGASCKNHLSMHLPTVITIEDHILSAQGEKFTHLRELEHVKKVVDYGDWYHIFFCFPHKSLAFLCQKDLLVEGTIEEFEEIFEEVMVRKIKKK